MSSVLDSALRFEDIFVNRSLEKEIRNLLLVKLRGKLVENGTRRLLDSAKMQQETTVNRLLFDRKMSLGMLRINKTAKRFCEMSIDSGLLV